MSIWILCIFICITKQKNVHSKTSTYKKTLHDFKAFEQVNQGHKRCYKSESLLRVTQTPSPAPSPLLKAVKLHARLRLLLLHLLIQINKLHENISGALYKKRSTWAQTHRACTDVCIFLVVQSQCDLGHIFQLKVKQREDVKKKAMWNVQCIEVCRASFMMNPPVSPVRWLKDKRRELFVKPRVSPGYVHASENVTNRTFFRRQRIFLLSFCFLQLGFVEVGHLLEIGLVRHVCSGSEIKWQEMACY